MPIKEFFRKYQPLQIYIVLSLTIFYFLVQLVVSHFTHSLTLLVDAYHVLCNLIALFGCITSFKYKDEGGRSPDSSVRSSLTNTEQMKDISDHHDHHKSGKHQCSHSSEKRLRNTFGWARIDVLVMLIGCIFLASLCFSVVVEALQTLAHISHHDEMHQPLQILLVGGIGMVLNVVCYLMIGGYTYYQGSFLRVGDSGDITLEKGISDSMNKRNSNIGQFRPKHQGPWEMTRDVIGCVIVMVCALIVYFTDANIGKYVDPILSIVSAILLLIFSYPFMRDAGYILMQTIPNHINLDSLCSQLTEAFPNIINVHEIHVWQLTTDKTVSTAHIIFLNPQDYLKYTNTLKEFFHQQGITHVTIQPEFYEDTNSMELVSGKYGSPECLIRCMSEECTSRNCCTKYTTDELQDVKVLQEIKSPPALQTTEKDQGTTSSSDTHCIETQDYREQNSTPLLDILKTETSKIVSTQLSFQPNFQTSEPNFETSLKTKSCVNLSSDDYFCSEKITTPTTVAIKRSRSLILLKD